MKITNDDNDDDIDEMTSGRDLHKVCKNHVTVRSASRSAKDGVGRTSIIIKYTRQTRYGPR